MGPSRSRPTLWSSQCTTLALFSSPVVYFIHTNSQYSPHGDLWKCCCATASHSLWQLTLARKLSWFGQSIWCVTLAFFSHYLRFQQKLSRCNISHCGRHTETSWYWVNSLGSVFYYFLLVWTHFTWLSLGHPILPVSRSRHCCLHCASLVCC